MNCFIIRNGNEVVDRETYRYLGMVFRPDTRGAPWTAIIDRERLEAETLG